MITFAFLDDNGDDNVMSSYERLKRWRAKNKVMVNLRQREYRRRKKTTPVLTLVPAMTKTKMEELRELAMSVSKEPAVEHAPTKPMIYRDDFGRVITERQWNLLRTRKQEAKEGGYEIDEWSQ